MLIQVRKSELLDALARNRETHRAIFLEAVDGYRAEAVKQLEAHIAAIKNGKMPVVYVHLAAPSDHTKDYDRVIGLVEMGVTDTIGLTTQEYANYVKDDWEWKRQFLHSNSTYSATAAAALEAEPTDE